MNKLRYKVIDTDDSIQINSKISLISSKKAEKEIKFLDAQYKRIILIFSICSDDRIISSLESINLWLVFFIFLAEVIYVGLRNEITYF